MTIGYQSAPPKGRYTGMVDGCPAIFLVEFTTISAWWLPLYPKAPAKDTWDVADRGQFQATWRGSAVDCTINKKSVVR